MMIWRKKSDKLVAADYPADRANSHDFLEAMMQFGVFAPILLETWGPPKKRAKGRRTS